MKLYLTARSSIISKRIPLLAAGTGLLAMAISAASLAVHSSAARASEPARARAGDCESMIAAKLPDTTITSAQSIAAGRYQTAESKVAFDDLPAFCRVTATIRPATDSAINIEMWLPAAIWNGRYQQVGNHGWAGIIHSSELAAPLRRGFATAATDNGHHSAGSPYDVSWAFGHPAKLEDMATRAVHELAQTAKLAIVAFYNKVPAKSYFNGCSQGGREGLEEAQAHPTDFNGILIGGAGTYFTRMGNEQLYVSQNLKNSGITGASGAAILQLAQATATAQCSKVPDAVVDGIIMDPRRCNWDPHTLICQAGQNPASCVTPDQADALARNTRPLLDPATGKRIFFGMPPGSEFDQVRFGFNTSLSTFGVANYKIAFNDPAWDGSTFDYRTDLPKLDQAVGRMNSLNPDLRKFQAAGGKMIQWHGWGDAVAMPEWITGYYDDVVAKTSNGSIAAAQSFFRLFMMPGVGHCGFGPGPENIGAEGQTPVSSDPDHDAVSGLMEWVEHGRAPARIIATRFNVRNDPKSGINMQRPLCPYPQSAVWDRSGDVDKASSFHCALLRQGATG